ncbi:MAG: hypothetical protein K2K93_06800, partial [Muribaculaceae bacterium]|nr:hypothetical protein [Muribaculaceae bacterium]
MLRTASNTSKISAKTEDPRALTSYSNYLLMQAQFAGNLVIDGHEASREEREIATECRELAGHLEEILQHCAAYEIAPLLECYDALYRLGHKRVPDADFMGRLQLKVITASEAGASDIPESHVFAIASSLMRTEAGAAVTQSKGIYMSLREKWILTLRKFNRFPNATAYETYQRLALLMQDAHSGASDAELYRWFDANRIDGFSGVSSMILESYRRYVMTLFPAVLGYDSQQALDTALLVELS